MVFIEDDELIDKIKHAFNVWLGELVEAKQGDISLLLEVFKLLREVNKPEAVQVFEQWCAWLSKFPR